jgi:nucleoid-associated protein YgaU
MGLFSFFKKAGKKTIKKNRSKQSLEEKNALLENMVNSLGLEICDLKVELKDDVVVVSGEAQSQSDLEKIVLSLGNIEGVASVESKMTVQNAAPQSLLYEIKSGDTLSKIAKAHYGDPMKYMVIFEANKPLLKDPDKIYPGQVIRIPENH